MDGLELIKRIRSNNTNMKIIILSAYGEFEYAQNAIKYDVDGYILKPIDEQKLEEVLDKITGKLKETNHNAANNSFSKNTLVNNARQYLESNYNSNISLEKMCEVLAVSKNYFCYLFKRETNHNIWDYLTNIRIEKAKELLKSSDMKIYEISDSVGFDDANYFTKLFKKITQVTPQQYRGKNE
jgi:YesN/AraC family two-component response regulator